jgi:hypothetical protein
MAAKIALENFPIFRPIEHCAPALEFADPFGRLLGVQFRHPPIVNVLTSAHGVREVNSPIVPVIDIREGGGHAAFSHHGVRLAEERFANQANPNAKSGRFDGCA